MRILDENTDLFAEELLREYCEKLSLERSKQKRKAYITLAIFIPAIVAVLTYLVIQLLTNLIMGNTYPWLKIFEFLIGAFFLLVSMVEILSYFEEKADRIDAILDDIVDNSTVIITDRFKGLRRSGKKLHVYTESSGVCFLILKPEEYIPSVNYYCIKTKTEVIPFHRCENHMIKYWSA